MSEEDEGAEVRKDKTEEQICEAYEGEIKGGNAFRSKGHKGKYCASG